MTERLRTAGAKAPAPSSQTSTATRTLLTFGLVAGPLFTLVALVQVLTRDGFDLSRHPLSLLSLGDLGWIQIANFVVSGVLAVGFAVGVRRALGGGRGAIWGPRLLALYGAGLVAGGVFVADPALGFPPGTPDGIPDHLSWHAILHAVAPPVAFLSLIAACFVFARRFAGLRQRRWAAYTTATAIACLALGAFPSQNGMSMRLALAQVVAWAWVFVLAARLLTDLGRAPAR
ncbi:MAG TPA: DUF998 domain-containing protein [Actinomycetes bacterium]|nr:DUF998 domain-containing protein [Actinomycetes bacterium]